jgi:hypothetical protein
MTEHQVGTQLGEPEKIVNFGAEAFWSYPALAVVFENRRTIDMKL